jgi:hypothetical protein
LIQLEGDLAADAFRIVMAGLVPAIHVFLDVPTKTWMDEPGHDEVVSPSGLSRLIT